MLGVEAQVAASRRPRQSAIRRGPVEGPAASRRPPLEPTNHPFVGTVLATEMQGYYFSRPKPSSASERHNCRRRRVTAATVHIVPVARQRRFGSASGAFLSPAGCRCQRAGAVDGRVEMWRGGCRPNISVAAPFVWRCLRAFPEKTDSEGDSQALANMIQASGWEEASMDGEAVFGGLASTYNRGS